MGLLAWILGILGGLCAVMGIITATEIIPVLIPLLDAAFNVMFWFGLAAILFLASIAVALGRTEYE